MEDHRTSAFERGLVGYFQPLPIYGWCADRWSSRPLALATRKSGECDAGCLLEGGPARRAVASASATPNQREPGDYQRGDSGARHPSTLHQPVELAGVRVSAAPWRSASPDQPISRAPDSRNGMSPLAT